MRTEEGLREKLSSLADLAKELEDRGNDLFDKMTDGVENGVSVDELDSINSEIGMIKNQILEIYGNAKAIRWCLGDIDDIQFATETGSSIIENNEGDF